MLSPTTNLGTHTRSARAGESNTAGAPVLIVAGAATDNVERTGPTVDRNVDGQGLADSCVLEIAGLYTLGAAATCSRRIRIQESADDSVWAAAEEIQAAATVVGTGPGGGGNVNCGQSVDMNLRGRQRYIRFLVTDDLSAGAADTGFYAARAVLGGYPVTPVA
jgi:hypothetical protein